MDSLACSALEEICANGSTGLPLPSLWPKLGGLPPPVRGSVWANLLRVPVLEFRTRTALLAPTDPSIQTVEDAEKMEVKVVAMESLRDNFLGLYDARYAAAKISPPQRRALERLATARENGVTQNQLGKEFHMEGNQIFFHLKGLESRGLITRQSALVRTREALGEGDSRNLPPVTTNVVYLCRYAKQLGPQQKFEITKERRAEGHRNASETISGEECLMEDLMGKDMTVKDHLPAMRAVVDRLRSAPGKVLVVSDIKRALGYTGASAGHKAWRTIYGLLEHAGLVEEFKAKVNAKAVSCLRLLKEFPAENRELDQFLSGNDDENEEVAQFGRRYRSTEQVVELPLEHQVLDMVITEQSTGLIRKEISERLGLDLKKSHARISNIVSRCGMDQTAESHGRGVAYRVRAPQLFYGDTTNALPYKGDLITSEESGERNTERELHGEICDDNEAEQAVPDLGFPGVGLGLPGEVPSGEKAATQKYRRTTADAIRRKQWVLERLQEEKFILGEELYKWIVKLEKDKSTKMDKKTVNRIVNKLQEEGQCKSVDINVPSTTNHNRNHIHQVILHPSVEHLSPPMVSKIHDRLRSFKMESHGHGTSTRSNSESVPLLEGVQRIQSSKHEARRADGFVSGKMVRVKLLHCFLWEYLNTRPDESSDLLSSSSSPCSSHCLFSIEEATKAIPVELFLQVVGSTQKLSDIITGKCRGSLRLADLTVQQYRTVMNNRATTRLSLAIDILRRLKLIGLANDGRREEELEVLHAVHSMELKPYIEEPLSAQSFGDLCPRTRHDFILSNREAVDEYWQTLEYCYATADPKATKHAFPGSAVREVFVFRSWASARVVTDEQHAELLEHVVVGCTGGSLSFKVCRKIAKDLDLTMAQVLRAYNDKRQKRLASSEGALVVRKRKRSPKMPLADVDTAGLSGGADHFRVENTEPVASPEDNDDLLKAPKDEGYPNKKMKPTRQRRSSWTDDKDRQLVIRYVKDRAKRGANYPRADWASIPDLPAQPRACARRIEFLNRNEVFRKALMRLVTVVRRRYEGHIGEEEEEWDDFTCTSVKQVLEEVLRLKRVPNLEASGEVQSDSEQSWNLDVGTGGYAGSLVEEFLPSGSRCEDNGKDRGTGQHHASLRRLQKCTRLSNKKSLTRSHLHGSLAVSNAVELLKVIFLNTSSAPRVSDILAESLRDYSPHDLLAAFSYLRQTKILAGDGTVRQYELSKDFIRNLSKSKFPANTGRRVSGLSRWLNERQNDLNEGEVFLSSGLECGDVVHLFSLVCLGEVSVSPSLPVEGVGEAGGLRNSKRGRASPDEPPDSSTTKKLKWIEGSEGSDRREKGFPGIRVGARRKAMQTAKAMELALRDSHFDSEAVITLDSIHDNLDSNLNQEKHGSVPDMYSHYLNAAESPWDAMSCYAEKVWPMPSDPNHRIRLHPDVFEAVYVSVQRAGDQGLTIGEVAQIADKPGDKVLELLVDVLQSFGRVVKVNAFDDVHVVDARYRPKYFLASLPGASQDQRPQLPIESAVGSDGGHLISEPKAQDTSSCGTADLDQANPSGGNIGMETSRCIIPNDVFVPIVPWVNGDGTINRFVYRSLVRRVLGIVMQNPGILEEGIIEQLDVLSPQSCRTLLKSMILGKHLVVRKMRQAVGNQPPSMLLALLGSRSSSGESKSILCEHFFANHMSGHLL